MSRHDQPEASPPPGWESCAPGEVARLAKKLRGRKSRRMFLRASVTTAASVLAVGGGWLAFGRRGDGEYDYGGITCSEVVRLGRDYMAGQVPEPSRSMIDAHVAKCPRCGPLFKQMREQMDQVG